MGFTVHETIAPNTGSGTRSCVRLFNFISLGVSLSKIFQNKSKEFSYLRSEFLYIFNRKGGN